MAVSIAQYVDLLFKKLQGVAKTANSTVKGASNESIASPAFIRGDIIWMESNQIPSTAQVVPGITQALTGNNSVQCTADTTVPPIGGVRPTWLSNEAYWVPQEFGSTWLPKVYVGPSGAANIEATGTQIFAAGISGAGEYYFDTQAGVLNFIGETIPSALSVGNVVYIAGYQYVGALGVQNNPGNVNLGNLLVSNTTISGNIANASITLEPTGSGVVIIDTTTGLVVPTGNTAQQPSPAATGTVRFNTDIVRLEVYDGVEWDSVVAGVTNQLFTGDGSTLVFTLDRDSTTAATLVMFNGVVQIPTIAYTVAGNLLTFAEPPLPTDTVDIRFL